MTRARNERGGIVLGWLTRILVMLVLIALVAFETGAVIVAKVTADRVAIDAAGEAGQVFGETGDAAKAEQAAKEVAAKNGADVLAFRVLPSRTAVEVRVRKRASTFIIQHIGALRRFQIAESTHTGKVQ